MFFDNWFGLLRVVVVGTLAYGLLLVMLRVSGKRTLSKMNAFDLIVTVALGSTLATVLLTNDVALAEGVLALAMLIGLQWVVTWLSVRSKKWSNFIKSEPRLLALHGHMLEDAMKQERVTEDEVHAAVRQQGIASLADVAAVVLETDGSVTVMGQNASGTADSLQPVKGYSRAVSDSSAPMRGS